MWIEGAAQNKCIYRAFNSLTWDVSQENSYTATCAASVLEYTSSKDLHAR